MKHTSGRLTETEGIACHPIWTEADWVVVHNLTLSPQATGANAGINAALVNTGTVEGTVPAGDTLWRTAQLWPSVEAQQADACSPVSLNLTLGVGPTRGRAGCDWRVSFWF